MLSKKPTSIAQPEKSSKKTKPTIEILSKRTKPDIEEPASLSNQRSDKVLKGKRDTSSYRLIIAFTLKFETNKENDSLFSFSLLGASKPSVITTEKTPLKPPPPPSSSLASSSKRLFVYF